MGVCHRVWFLRSWDPKHVPSGTGKLPKGLVEDRRENGDDLLSNEYRLSLRCTSGGCPDREGQGRLSIRAAIWRISHDLWGSCAGGASRSERWLESYKESLTIRLKKMAFNTVGLKKQIASLRIVPHYDNRQLSKDIIAVRFTLHGS